MKEEMAADGVHKKVLNLISKKNKKVLDVACGKGIMSKRLKDRGHDVISVDIERQSKYNLNFIKADLNKNFPFNKEEFDIVIAIEIIEHIENPRHFMRELKRVTKKGGQIIVTTPNITHWKARIKFLLTGVHWCFRDIDYIESGHITPVKLKDFEKICNEIGIKINKVTYNDSESNWFGGIMIFDCTKTKQNI